MDLSIRQILERLISNPANETDWIDIRSPLYPWKHIVAAAERDEACVSRIGRRLYMRREDLDRWMKKHFIPKRPGSALKFPKSAEPTPTPVEQMLMSAGFRRKQK